MSGERLAQLERCARFYGSLRLAIAWTVTNTARDPDDTQPKKVTTNGWQHTRQLAGADFAAGVFKRGLQRNPALVLRPSGLVAIECDTEAGLTRIAALDLPPTVTVCSSKPYKRHYWFRPPLELERLPFVCFRFEEAGLSADSERYLLCPPAIHPSGATYGFLDGHAPDEIEIAVMPLTVYQQLVAEHAAERGQEREALQRNPDAKIKQGQRRRTIFRFASMQRRWTSSRELILRAALDYNRAHCEPPLSDEQVASQVDGAMKMRGEQELAASTSSTSHESTTTAAEVVRAFQEWLHFPDLDLLFLTVAVVLANRMEAGDPVWVMIVGGSSRGKTELLNAFAGLDDVRVVGSLTEAALLSGTPPKQRAKNASGGLLRELPAFGATIVVKDFGAVLTLPRDRRAVVVQALREVYDGRYVRDVGTSGGQHLEWQGRLGLIAGATGALDAHGSVIAALGERWLTLRLASSRKGVDDDIAMARRALAGGQTQSMRSTLSEALCGYVATLEPPELDALDSTDERLLIALSVLVAKARSPVERDPRTREIEFIPQGEGPGRFARQLHKLMLCLYALGLGRVAVHRAIIRLGLDSIPPVRRRTLELLLQRSDTIVSSKVGVALGLPTSTAGRVLEDLNAHGLVDKRKTGEGTTAPYEWWATSLARKLWEQLTAEPHGYAEDASPDMSPSLLSKERESVEEDFSGEARAGASDEFHQVTLEEAIADAETDKAGGT